MNKRVNRVEKPPRVERAFSLIEMLVVIAVIGILAAILLGVLPGVAHRKKMALVQVELTQLQNAIDYYKEKNGFYPPDNRKAVPGPDSKRPPLFYELVGTTHKGDEYFPLNGAPRLSSADITTAFGEGGFLNSGEEGEVQNFYPTLSARQYQRDPNNNNVVYLVAPAKASTGSEFNTWRYIVSKPRPGPNDRVPTHNPNSYDLWAEVVYGGKTNEVGNWKK
jgi:prepilin-type N-terminal cleavage/methylation domain-containing protein